MWRRIRIALEWLDGCPDAVFLSIDAAAAAFILLAHGGALMITRLGKAPMFERYVPLLMASIAVALVVFASAVVALAVRRLRRATLEFHGVVLAVLAAAALGTAAYWVVAGIPSGSFGWTPGFLTALVVYPAYLLRRAFWARPSPGGLDLGLLPIWVGGLAFVLDCGIGIRLALSLSMHFAGRS